MRTRVAAVARRLCHCCHRLPQAASVLPTLAPTFNLVTCIRPPFRFPCSWASTSHKWHIVWTVEKRVFRRLVSMLKFWKKKSSAGSADGGSKTGGAASSSQRDGELVLAAVEQLREAVESNNVSQVKKVLSSHPSAANASIDELGQTCIHLAAIMGNVECMEQLLKHGDVNVADSTGRTALHASVDHPELLRLLLKKKSLDVNRLGFNRQSLLHIMAKKVAPIDEEMWILLRKVRFCSIFGNASRAR